MTTDYTITPAPFTAVTFADAFWRPRLETNRRVTLPFNFRKCEETGRIDLLYFYRLCTSASVCSQQSQCFQQRTALGLPIAHPA